MEYNYESCPIEPWVQEIVTRMHETVAAGQYVVNLSYTHPRSYIPTKILRRRQVRAVLNGWAYDNSMTPPSSYPVNRYFLAPGAKDLNSDALLPYHREIEMREYEAAMEAYNQSLREGKRIIPVLDLTAFHPRGAIPPAILARLSRRTDKAWRSDATAEYGRLIGDANKAVANAKNMEERAEGLVSKGGDPSKLLAAAEVERLKAKELRAQADFLDSELSELE